MFFCQSASVVSSTGEAEAMPALEMQMSTPPNFQALSRKPAITASSRVTSTQALATTSALYFLLQLGLRCRRVPRDRCRRARRRRLHP